MTTSGFPRPLETATASEAPVARKTCAPARVRLEVTFQLGRGSHQEQVGCFHSMGDSQAVLRVHEGNPRSSAGLHASKHRTV